MIYSFVKKNTFIALAMMIMSSCSDNSTNPEWNEGDPPLYDGTIQLRLECMSFSYDSEYLLSAKKHTDCFAHLFNGNSTTDPKSAYAEGTKLANLTLNGAHFTGSWATRIENFPTETDRELNWQFIGWAGLDYETTQEMLDEIIIISPKYLDTVSISKGIEIELNKQFSTLKYCISGGAFENKAILNSMESYPYCTKYVKVENSNFIKMDSTYLSTLLPNHYYQIELITSMIYDNSLYKGRVVYKSSSYHTFRTIYLIK